MNERLKDRLSPVFALMAAIVLSLALVPAMAYAGANPATNDSTASITVSSGLAQGDTVQAYRIIEATIDPTTNAVVFAFASGISYNDDADGGLAAFMALTGADLKAAVERLAVQAKTAGIPPVTGVAGADGSAVVQNLPMGQYLLLVAPGDESTAQTVYQVTTVNLVPQEGGTGGAYKLDDATVNDIKSENIDIPKTVTDPATGQQATTTDGYQNGDALTFTLKPVVPTYPADTDTTQTINKLFVVGDSMSEGLDFSQEQFEAVSVKDADGNELTKNTDYTIEKAERGFTITFNYDNISALAGTSLTISYQATLNAKAADGVEVNTATLEYNRNPFDSSSHDTITTEVEDYSFGIYLKKINEAETALAGAEFEVFDASGKSMGTFTTDADGYGGLNGLKEAGVYTLREIVVPSGYVAVPDITVIIDKTQATGDNPATAVVESNYQNAGQITDSEQPELPTTGGAGTMVLTAIGVLLAAACIVLAVRYRRSTRAE